MSQIHLRGRTACRWAVAAVMALPAGWVPLAAGARTPGEESFGLGRARPAPRASTEGRAPRSRFDDLPPLQLMQLIDPEESIYEAVGPPRPEQGVNEGGVNLDLTVRYMTDYVFRGVDQSERLARIGTDGDAGLIGPAADAGAEDAPNLQFDGYLEFDLGKAPHPIVGLFVNVFDDDPGSEFQEIRPYVGLEWELRPLTIAGGHITYIYPEREDLNTSEVWMSVTLDDAFLWKTPGPVLSPYGFAAYDYELYDGVYVEAGVRHEREFEDLDLTLTATAAVAYVSDHGFFVDPQSPASTDEGFHHYEIGLIGAYSLNDLLNIPRRYGQWTLKGYLYYTDGIDPGLLVDTQVWGGAGIQFLY